MSLLKQAQQAVGQRAGTGSRAPRGARVQCGASGSSSPASALQAARRQLLQQGAALALAATVVASPALAAGGLPVEPVKQLCDAECVSKLESVPMVTTASGLQYKDIVQGTGPEAQVGYQAVVHYVASLPNGRQFENSLERGTPFDIRVGTGQVVAGLDEALQSMRAGGQRRVYVPGELSFPKNIKAAAGRPSVPANSPVIFDVKLLYIPGLEDE